MLKRTITGFFILLAVVGFVFLREVSVLFFDAFALIIILGATVEMVLAAKFKNKQVDKILLTIVPVALMLIYIFTKGETAILLQVALVLIAFIYLMAKELIVNMIKRRKNEHPTNQDELNQSLLNETKNTMEIIIYPIIILGFLFGINHLGVNLGYVGIIMVFAVSMMTDVFAYLFGSLIKGPRMAPEISPKKSISGMVFGALGGIIAGGLGYLLFVHLGLIGDCFGHLESYIQILMFVVIGVVGTFLTQFGDLVASSYKRKVGIKDFGSIFPGHGGFMDRVDGLMFTSALVYVVFALLV